MIDRNDCPVCGESAPRAREVGRLGAKAADGTRLVVRLVECPGCQHVFVDQAPEPAELSPFYQGEYHVFADEVPGAEEVRQMVAGAAEAGRYNHAPIVPGGRYLDVGCGLGTMVAAMAELGMESSGVEPNEIAVRRGARAAARSSTACSTKSDCRTTTSTLSRCTTFWSMSPTRSRCSKSADAC